MVNPPPAGKITWRPHPRAPRRWVSTCGHYERTASHTSLDDVYDAWFHIGQPDFQHVGFSKDLEQLDRLVTFHAERKHLLSPPPPADDPA